jgi:uncharacterized protein (TIGR02145 family)
MKKAFLIISVVFASLISSGQMYFGQNFSTVTITTATFDTIEIMDYNLNVTDGGAGIYYPNGSAGNLSGYGYLYTYAAAVRITATFPGWRLPTSDDLLEINGYFGGDNAGCHMRESGTTYWTSPNTCADNSSGFNGRGAGMYMGIYSNFQNTLYFWSSTAYDASNQEFGLLNYATTTFGTGSYMDKTRALSVRLIKN